MPDPAQDRLASAFDGAPLSEHGARWDGLWADGFTPWDRGGPSAALDDLLARRPDLVPGPPTATAAAAGRRRTALVPGCGRGYDVALLAAFGYDACGLDLSAAAIRRAREVQDRAAGDEAYRAREGVERPGRVAWLTGDFFEDEFLERAGVRQFDLIYDYTFLCALPPAARPAWARRMAELLAPDGRLVCLEFPSAKPPAAGGPPYGVAPETYDAHLSRPGEEVPYDGEGRVVAAELGGPAGDALRRIARLTPARTHRAGCGEDGSVVDRISVWGH